MLVGVDIGTTHCKAGLIDTNGAIIQQVSVPTPTKRTPDGYPLYDAEQLWQVVQQAIADVTRNAGQISGVGVASMAESGLLVDRNTGQARTDMIPWHSQQASAAVDVIRQAGDMTERFTLAGIRLNAKCGLTKLVWLQTQNPDLLTGAVWLSAADYIVYRLTGVFVTDHSLAGRTFAFRMDQRRWDADWLAQFGLTVDLFPPAHPSGTLYPSTADCLPPDTPVCIAGHDHVCAAFATGTIAEPAMLNSIGTAETLLGAWNFRPLTAEDEASGLLFGCHVIPNTTYWMGSLSASGGSIEWMRHLLDEPPLTYAELLTLIEPITAPTGILYYPYLSGSDQSITDQATFIGLQHKHGRGDLIKAVIEGITYEIEHIRAIVTATLGITAQSITVAGGGTRNQAWMQIKADVSGVPQRIYPSAEATVLGAALVAGLGAGVYRSPAEAVNAVNRADNALTIIEPRADHHARYRELFAGYQRLLPALRDFYR